MIWFSSDYHFQHFNILEYCKRPFKTIEEMNDKIIANHNAIVSPDDTVYFLGDFCFNKNGIKAEDFLKKMNGKFIFIKGNHDDNRLTINHLAVIEYKGKMICLIHRPIDFEIGFDLTFCGHVHQAWKFCKVSKNREDYLLNVGLDVWNFKPVSIDVLLGEFERAKKLKEIKTIKISDMDRHTIEEGE
jgi:calcineurin-like phosphoesterase family protein